MHITLNIFSESIANVCATAYNKESYDYITTLFMYIFSLSHKK